MSRSINCAENPKDSIVVQKTVSKKDESSQALITIYMAGDPSVIFLSESGAIELADALYRIARISA